jgi:hypothetical protein
MREWLHIQFALLRCAPKILAAVATGNETALRNIQADVDILHHRWHGDG